MALKGSPELRRRLKAIKMVATPAERAWADAAAKSAKRRLGPYRRTGKTISSIHARVSQKKGRMEVVGLYTVNFIDAGAKAHDEPKSRYTKTGRLRRGKAAGTGKLLKFAVGGKTVFAKKVHKRAQPAHPFKAAAARDGLRKVDPIGELIKAWNRAA